MSTHIEEVHVHGATIPTFAKVWGVLLLFTGVEVFLAYEQVPTLIMLTALIGSQSPAQVSKSCKTP